MRFRVMIVQIAGLETHQTSRTGVRFLLADLLMHPPVAFQQCTISEIGRAEIADKRFVHVNGRCNIRGGRGARGHGRGMRDLVHLQMAQRNESS